jgi:hypothetical protein
LKASIYSKHVWKMRWPGCAGRQAHVCTVKCQVVSTHTAEGVSERSAAHAT